MMTKKRTNIYLRPDQTRQLKALSKKTGSSSAELVRRAVDEYIEKETKVDLKLDEAGKIIPDRESFETVAREYANSSDAEKYRLAQAHMLMKWGRAQDRKRSRRKV